MHFDVTVNPFPYARCESGLLLRPNPNEFCPQFILSTFQFRQNVIFRGSAEIVNQITTYETRVFTKWILRLIYVMRWTNNNAQTHHEPHQFIILTIFTHRAIYTFVVPFRNFRLASHGIRNMCVKRLPKLCRHLNLVGHIDPARILCESENQQNHFLLFRYVLHNEGLCM